MTLLRDAYDILRRCKLVSNHATFSTTYLNKGARYFDHLICSGRQPALDALFSLHVRCKAVGEAYAVHPAACQLGKELVAIAGRIWDEMERRSCSLLRRRVRPTPTTAQQRPGPLARCFVPPKSFKGSKADS